MPDDRYIVRHTPHIVSVFFEESRDEIDEVASTEHDFGASRAFVSAEGELVLVVDASALTSDELAHLESLSGRGAL